jgi:hypothetical protein
MHADRPPASSWPLGTIIRVKIKAPKFPNHRVLVVLLPVLVVGCLFGVFPCSRVLSFVSLSLPEEEEDAGWLAGWLSGLCAFLSLSRAAAAASLSPRTPAANKRYGLGLFSFPSCLFLALRIMAAIHGYGN